MGSVGCLGQIENIKRQSLATTKESLFKLFANHSQLLTVPTFGDLLTYD